MICNDLLVRYDFFALFYALFLAPVKDILFDNTGHYVISAGGRYMRVFHNVVGYKATIVDLKERLRTAKSDSLKQRLKEQIQETE